MYTEKSHGAVLILKEERGVQPPPQLLGPLLFRLWLLSSSSTWGSLSQNCPAVPFPNSLPTESMRGKKIIAVILSHEGLIGFVS